MALNDLTGFRFEKLLVLSREENDKDGTARWLCVCDCGESRIVAGTGLRAGRNKSCGCASPRFKSDNSASTEMRHTRAYSIWRGMVGRCSEKATGKSRRNYFLKGITVADEWMDFVNFYKDMGDPPAGMSIERMDGNKGYYKGNCKWATDNEQANNTSQNVPITFQGVTKNLSQWAEYIGVKPNTLLYRLKRGMPLERVLQKVAGNARTIKKESRQRPCEVCGDLFTPRTSQLAAGRGKFCSQKCNAASKKGIHGDRRLLKARKLDEMDLLSSTIEALNL